MMMGHAQVWDYGWSFFTLALDEAVKWMTPPKDKA